MSYKNNYWSALPEFFFLTRSTYLALKGNLDDSFSTNLYGPFLAVFPNYMVDKSDSKKAYFPFVDK